MVADVLFASFTTSVTINVCLSTLTLSSHLPSFAFLSLAPPLSSFNTIPRPLALSLPPAYSLTSLSPRCTYRHLSPPTSLLARFPAQQGKLSGPRSLLAGLGAGMCEAVFAVTPSETIK